MKELKFSLFFFLNQLFQVWHKTNAVSTKLDVRSFEHLLFMCKRKFNTPYSVFTGNNKDELPKRANAAHFHTYLSHVTTFKLWCTKCSHEIIFERICSFRESYENHANTDYQPQSQSAAISSAASMQVGQIIRCKMLQNTCIQSLDIELNDQQMRSKQPQQNLV